MEYKDIVKNLKNQNYEKMYLFYGKEYFLIDNIVKILKENVSMKDFNLDIVDGRETSIQSLTSSIETVPFMEDKKIIIIKDFELLKGKKKNFSENDEKEFINYLSKTPKSTIIVFLVYGDIDSRKTIVKSIKKNGLLSKNDKLDDMTLFKWLIKKFNEQNVEIGNSEIIYFIENSGYKEKNSNKTLEDLYNEVKKLSSSVKKFEKVSYEDIDNLTQRKIENDIFKLIDFIANKNASSAIKILNDMIFEGESPSMIYIMICRQLKLIIRVKELSKKKISNKEIAKKISSHDFLVNKAYKQGKNFSVKILIEMINFISKSEYEMKNGLIKDTLSVEMFVSKFCDKNKTLE